VPTPARGPGLTQTKLLAATAAKQLFFTYLYLLIQDLNIWNGSEQY
jgi:hypothetical protein